jgi:hypothetical protein
VLEFLPVRLGKRNLKSIQTVYSVLHVWVSARSQGKMNFLGPAALAKLYRFHIDPSEADDESRLMLANSKFGW